MNRYILHTFFVLVFLFTLSAQNEQTELKQIEWLLGKWQRTNVKEGTSAFEEWSKIGSDKFTGTGIAMKGSDTTFVEKLSLLIRDNKLYYAAEVSHNAEPTYFEVTEMDDSGFVCENPEHDFPKKIEYKLEAEDKLTATISGDGKAIPFNFRRVK